MKTTAILTATLGLTLGSLHAQTVPPFINYQGTVTDSNNVGLGTGTPVNRKVIFRIFDAATGGNRLWSEQHTVTIADGQFSVLLGNGINANYAGVDEVPLKTATPLDTVFTSAGITRYVEIVVDNGDNTLNAGDAPIAPRQQITSTAYSFRARSADTIASGSDLQLNGSDNYGLGYYGATRLFNGAAIDGPVLFGQAGGALGSVNGGTKNIALRWNENGAVGIGSADLTGASALTKLVLQGDDTSTAPQQLNIRGNTDTNKRLLLGYNTTSNYGSLQAYSAASTATNLLLNRIGGNVGIGTSNPGDKLDVAGNLRVSGGGLRMWNNSGNDSTRAMTAALVTNEINGLSGNGTDAGQLRLSAGGGSGSQNKTAIDLYGFGTNDMRFFTNGTERLRVASGGKVGVRTATPAANLHVTGVETSQMDLGSPTGVTFAVGNALGQYGLNFGVRGDGSSWIQGGRTDGSDTPYNISLQASGGNVGIGTTTPSALLDIRNSSGANESLRLSGAAFNATGGTSTQGISFLLGLNRDDLSRTDLMIGNSRKLAATDSVVRIVPGSGDVSFIDSVTPTGSVFKDLSFQGNSMRILANGNVGIGTQTPTKAKLEVNGAAGNHTLTTTFREYSKNSVGGAGALPNSTGANSIYASGRLAGQDFIAFSDLRIKRVEGHSDPSQDLAALRGIEVTDYTYIDTVAKTPGKYKKVIAQQVEKVYPLAVSRSTDVVPDIYRKAMVENGWLMLATDLKIGERVRLIGEKKEGIHEVLEVAEGRFRTDFAAECDEVFVYGREVNDFRSVDYEAISMLNVSATQELARKLDEKDAQIAELQKRLDALETKDKARDSKLSSIEALLRSSGKAATVSVSMKEGE